MAAAAAGRECGRARRRASGAGASGGGSRGTRGAGAAGWTARSPPGLPARPPSPPRGRDAGVHTLRTLPGRGAPRGQRGGTVRPRPGRGMERPGEGAAATPSAGRAGEEAQGEPLGDPGTPAAKHSAEQRRHLAPARQPRSLSPRPGTWEGQAGGCGAGGLFSGDRPSRNADPPAPLTGGWAVVHRLCVSRLTMRALGLSCSEDQRHSKVYVNQK